jgi:hypothetical protein
VIAGSAMVGEIESPRFVTDEVAVVVANGRCSCPCAANCPGAGCPGRSSSASAPRTAGGSR